MNASAAILYTSLLNDQKLMPLSLFKSNKFSKYNLFPHAHTLPTFFQTNLQSEGRIVKFLKGPEGAFRGFYYQLFKLGFEVDQCEKNYATIIKNIIFDPHLSGSASNPISGKQYNISQYLRIIAEFILVMQSQVIPNAELTFSQYPIIDESMLTILSLIIEKYQSQHNQKIQSLTQLLTKLCNIFQITLEVYDNCYSFEQSDVFLYAESPVTFYLAFLSEMAEVESYDKTSQSPADQQFREQLSSNSYTQNKDQGSIYRDIRLSAGNRGTRARVTNRSLKDYKANNLLYVAESISNQKQSQNSQKKNQKTSKSGYEQENILSFQNQQQKLEDEQYKVKVSDSKESQQHIYPLSADALPLNKDLLQIDTNKRSFKQNKLNPGHKELQQQLNQVGLDEKNQSEKNIAEDSGLMQQHARNHSSSYATNEGLNPVFQSIHTYKSISDSLPESWEKFQSKNSKDQKDVFSKLGQNSISESVQYEASNSKKSERRKSQVQVNGTTYKYEFKSMKYQCYNRSEKPTKDFEPSQNMFKKKQNKYVKDEELFKGRINQSSRKINQLDFTQFSHKAPIETLPIPEKKHFEMQFYVPKQRKGEIINPFNEMNKNDKLKLDKMGILSKKEESLGTFYRQFTDTRVMEIMDEPFKTHVKITRQKFKGIRSKNFKGFFL